VPFKCGVIFLAEAFCKKGSDLKMRARMNYLMAAMVI